MAIGTSAGPAAAAEGDGVDISTFVPSSSPASLFELVLPEPKDHLEWYVGGLAHYAHNPVHRTSRIGGTDEVVEEADPVAMRVTAEVFAALGLLGFGEIGLAVPFVAFQDGEGAVPGGRIQRFGLGDPRVEVKVRFLEAAGLDLGAGAVATAPAGHYLSSGKDFLGDRLPSVEPRLMASFDAAPVVVALDAGFLARSGATLGDYDQRHALTWNAGIAFDVADFHEPGGLRLAAETNGMAGIDFDSLTETPMEALVGVKYRTEGDAILSVGAGPGMSTAVGVPSFRVFAGLAYDSVLRNCPAGPEDIDGFRDGDKCVDPDNDEDGLSDADDRCPNDREDPDGFQDEDGCPDPDNDGDGIPDAADKCPLVAEDANDFEDQDGCPEGGPGRPMVKITDTQILISSKIYFDFDKATIREVSYPILDAVAQALAENPNIRKVRIEGHSDNEGTEAYNLALSRDRAKAVMDYLVAKGTASERLTYEGYGFTRPKASNKTEEGRAINRRVEFTILERD